MLSAKWRPFSLGLNVLTPQQLEIYEMHNQHCGYWNSGTLAPGHQQPQCWDETLYLLYCIGFIKIIPFTSKNIKK